MTNKLPLLSCRSVWGGTNELPLLSCRSVWSITKLSGRAVLKLLRDSRRLVSCCMLPKRGNTF